MASNDYFVIKEEHRNGPWNILCSLNNHSNSTKEHSSLKDEKDMEEKDEEKKYKFRFFEWLLFFEDSFLVKCKYCKKNIQIDSITSHHTGCKASSSVSVNTYNSSPVYSHIIKQKEKSNCRKNNSVKTEKKTKSGRKKKKECQNVIVECQDVIAGCQDGITGCQDLIVGCQSSSLLLANAHNSFPVDSPIKVQNVHNSSPVHSPLRKKQEEYYCRENMKLVNSVDIVNKEEKAISGCQDLPLFSVDVHNSSLDDRLLIERKEGSTKKNKKLMNNVNKVQKTKTNSRRKKYENFYSFQNTPNSSPVDSPLITKQEEYNCRKPILDRKINSVTVKPEVLNHVTERESNSTKKKEETKVNSAEVKLNDVCGVLSEIKAKKRKREETVVKNETEIKKPFLGNSESSAVECPKPVENSVPIEPPAVREKPLNQSFLYLSQRLYCASSKISANRLRHSNCGLVLLNGYTNGIRESMMKVFNNEKPMITNVEKNNLQHRKEAPPLLVRNSTMPSEDLSTNKLTNTEVKTNNGASNGNSKLNNGNFIFPKQFHLVNGIDGNGHLNDFD